MVRPDDINGDHYPELVVPGDGKGAVYYYESVGASTRRGQPFTISPNVCRVMPR